MFGGTDTIRFPSWVMAELILRKHSLRFSASGFCWCVVCSSRWVGLGVVLVNRDPKWFFVLVLEVGATLVLPLLPLCGRLVVEAMIALVARVNPLVAGANPLVAHSNMEEGG